MPVKTGSSSLLRATAARGPQPPAACSPRDARPAAPALGSSLASRPHTGGCREGVCPRFLCPFSTRLPHLCLCSFPRPLWVCSVSLPPFLLCLSWTHKAAPHPLTCCSPRPASRRSEGFPDWCWSAPTPAGPSFQGSCGLDQMPGHPASACHRVPHVIEELILEAVLIHLEEAPLLERNKLRTSFS